MSAPSSVRLLSSGGAAHPHEDTKLGRVKPLDPNVLFPFLWGGLTGAVLGLPLPCFVCGWVLISFSAFFLKD